MRKILSEKLKLILKEMLICLRNFNLFLMNVNFLKSFQIIESENVIYGLNYLNTFNSFHTWLRQLYCASNFNKCTDIFA